MTKLADTVEMTVPGQEFVERWANLEKVRDRPMYLELANCLVMAQAIFNKLDGERKEVKQPFLDGGRSIDAKFNKVLKPLKKQLDHMRKLVAKFESNERNERILEARHETKDMKDRERAKDIERMAALTPQGYAPGIQWEQDIDIGRIDLERVSADYIVIDHAKTKALVKAAYRNGIRSFPGMEVFVKFRPKVVATKGDK